MPAFVPIIPNDLHKLLENRAIASRTFCREPRGIMEMAVDVTFMLVVGVLRAKHGRADRTRKMFDMVLFV